MTGETTIPDVGLCSKYQVQYGLGSHPANWHQSTAVEPIVVGRVNVSSHAEICTKH